jgi:hypothetical protein
MLVVTTLSFTNVMVMLSSPDFQVIVVASECNP